MKVLALNGSPRKDGNTVTLQKKFLEGISQNQDNTVREIDLQGKNINPCIACNACEKRGDKYCVISDDTRAIYDAFLNSDLVVFSTPVYWWGMTAQIKLFVDRLYALIWDAGNLRFRKKKIVLILTFGGEEPNSGADLVVNTFKEISEYIGWELIKVIRYCSKDGHVSKDKQKLSESFESGTKIGVS
jgi:multimeric flavodoxin WrbA